MRTRRARFLVSRWLVTGTLLFIISLAALQIWTIPPLVLFHFRCVPGVIYNLVTIYFNIP